MSAPIEIIVSPKSLERQIKILDERILELQAEVASLEKKREACHVLLGIPVTPVSAPVEAAAVAVKKTMPRKKREEERSDAEDESVSVEALGAEAAEDEGASAAH